MSKQRYMLIERTVIGLMILGMAGMFQPFVGGVFGASFLLLLFSTIGFILISHMAPSGS